MFCNVRLDRNSDHNFMCFVHMGRAPNMSILASSCENAFDSFDFDRIHIGRNLVEYQVLSLYMSA